PLVRTDSCFTFIAVYGPGERGGGDRRARSARDKPDRGPNARGLTPRRPAPAITEGSGPGALRCSWFPGSVARPVGGASVGAHIAVPYRGARSQPLTAKSLPFLGWGALKSSLFALTLLRRVVCRAPAELLELKSCSGRWGGALWALDGLSIALGTGERSGQWWRLGLALAAEGAPRVGLFLWRRGGGRGVRCAHRVGFWGFGFWGLFLGSGWSGGRPILPVPHDPVPSDPSP